MRKNDIVLHIDLSAHSVQSCFISKELTDRFLGGRGLAAVLSYRLIPKGCDPLGPGNILTICTGLLTGTPAPASARTHFCALSPLTGVLGSSNAGGFFGSALRSQCIQGLVITGRSPRPVYLFIDRGTVRILPADRLWGTDTRQCVQQIGQTGPGDALRVLSIGPAGENRSAMACIMIDTHSAAGRTGIGAVMGSKNLKAVAVNGMRHKRPMTGHVRRAVAQYAGPLIRTEPFKAIGKHGQSGYIRWCNEMGMLATRNYQSGTFSHAGSICGSSMQDRVIRRRACDRCPIHCKADIIVPGGFHVGETGSRPEFESIAALGAKCGQKDKDAVMHLSDCCNRLGLDTISAGSAIAFAMELYEKGIITEKDTHGMALRWGDTGVQTALLEQMAHRRGFGALLADGVHRAAKRIGRDSQRFAFHCKGLELCAYDPRGSMSTALGYAVSGRGGDFASVFANAEVRWDEKTALDRIGHRQGANRFSPIAKAALVRRCSICSAVVDALGICKVVALGIPAAFDLKAEAALVRAIHSRHISAEALFTVGERIITLERLFNLRHGNGQGNRDLLPDRFLEEPLEPGSPGNKRLALGAMLAEYYDLMGWDDGGVPWPEQVHAMGLDDIHEKPPSIWEPCRFN